MKKVRTGRVTSNKMSKTAVVAVEDKFPHPMFHKVIRRLKKFKAHDEKNLCSIGDVVEIEETRPLSHDKRWRVVRILSKGEAHDQRSDALEGGRQ